jgi:hypothetical protein
MKTLFLFYDQVYFIQFQSDKTGLFSSHVMNEVWKFIQKKHATVYLVK